MTTGSLTFRNRELKAPRQSGETLQLPPAAELTATVEANRQLISSQAIRIAEQPIERLREAARQEVVRAAADYTRHYRDVPSELTSPSATIMSGHQPQLFHPGVWFKNLVLSRLGQAYPACPVNLIVDNDLCVSTRLPIPAGDDHNMRIARIPYDRGGRVMPYEHRGVCEPAVFKNFSQEVAKSLPPIVSQPLVHRLWPYVLQAYQRTGNLGQALAGGRHRLEEDFGWRTLELPLSEVCRTDGFAWFAQEILQRHREFFGAYNQTVRAYREQFDIRNPSRPVPLLVQHEDWYESPFWIWTRERPVRRPLFVKETAEGIALSDLAGTKEEAAGQTIAELLPELDRQGIVVRPRALLTTMFARLILCDLFIHGIGGAKYDELTDVIAEEFFHVELPEFATMTATMRLPVDIEWVSRREVSQYRQQLRQLYYHPEKHIDNPNEEAAGWIAAKRQLLRQLPPRRERARWHRELTKTNEQLRNVIKDKLELMRSAIDHAEHQLEISQVLGNREFSFCLFPDSLVNDLDAAISL